MWLQLSGRSGACGHRELNSSSDSGPQSQSLLPQWCLKPQSSCSWWHRLRTPKPRGQKRRPTSWWSWHDARNLNDTSSAKIQQPQGHKKHQQHFQHRQWTMKRADSQIQPKAAWVRETKNLVLQRHLLENKRKAPNYQLELLGSKQIKLYLNKKSVHYSECTGRQDSSLSTIKTHGHTVPQKENDNSLETKLKVTEDCDITNRKFKVTVRKKLNQLQENLRKQVSELRNKINGQKSYQRDWNSNKELNEFWHWGI